MEQTEPQSLVEYIGATLWGELHGIGKRRVNDLARDGRIEGAIKANLGKKNIWVIPKNSPYIRFSSRGGALG